MKIEDWYYYYQISKNEFQNPFDGKITHLSFIENYFQKGGKKQVLHKFDVNNFLPNNAPHTNSVFFTGIFIYHNTIFKEYLDDSFTDQGYRLFSFVWFLTTLFHDFGYKYEDEFENYKHIIDIETLRKHLKIRHNLLKYKKIKGVHQNLYDSIRKYFLYRRFNSKHRNKIDHGILAGLFFYDALLKNRIEQNANNPNGELYFGKSLNKIYAQVAAVIATHNIWLPNYELNQEYKKFGMDNLVNMPPVKITESPLLVLLGIIDTIDPVKIYKNNIDCNNILDEILMSCDDKKIVLEKSSKSNLDFSKITKRASGLNVWLNVTTEISDNKLTISITI